MGFIRFTIDEIDSDSLKPLGVLNAAFELQRKGKLSKDEDALIDQLRNWFNTHLDRPERFSRSRSKARNKRGKALSWFKDSAVDHIRQMRAVGAILEAHGITCRMIVCERPGYVVYEDEHQIVAEPFSDTPT